MSINEAMGMFALSKATPQLSSNGIGVIYTYYNNGYRYTFELLDDRLVLSKDRKKIDEIFNSTYERLDDWQKLIHDTRVSVLKSIIETLTMLNKTHFNLESCATFLFHVECFTQCKIPIIP
jgi:hypothetical protein